MNKLLIVTYTVTGPDKHGNLKVSINFEPGLLLHQSLTDTDNFKAFQKYINSIAKQNMGAGCD
jgi:hypothetical protein